MELLSRIEELAARFDEARAHLLAAAQLLAEGRVPAVPPIAELLSEFDRMRREAALPADATLDDLRAFARAHSGLLNELRSLVLRLASSTPSDDFAKAVEEARRQACELLDRGETDAVAALVALARDRATMTPLAFEEAFDRTEIAFGKSIALSVAGGRISVEGESQDGVASIEPMSSDGAVPADAEAGFELHGDRFDADAETQFDSSVIAPREAELRGSLEDWDSAAQLADPGPDLEELPSASKPEPEGEPPRDTPPTFEETVATHPAPSTPEAWNAVIQGMHSQPVLAYHLAAALERAIGGEPLIPASVLRMYVIGSRLRAAYEEFAKAVDDMCNEVDIAVFDPDDKRSNALRLIIAAGTMRPALLGPATGAVTVLTQLGFDGAIGELVELVAHYGNLFQGLDPQTLGNSRRALSWEEEAKTLEGDVREWVAKAKRGKLSFQAATRVALVWLEKDGFIGKMLPGVGLDVHAMPDSYAEDIAEITYRAIDAAIEDTDEELRERSDRIVGKAKLSLRSLVHEALDFAQRWIRLERTRAKAAGYIGAKADICAQALDALMPRVRQAVLSLEQDEEPLVAVSAAIFMHGIESARAMFEAESHRVPESATFVYDLLRAQIRIDENGDPAAAVEVVISALVAAIETPPPAWSAAFWNLVAREDFRNARVLLQIDGADDNAVKPGEVERLLDAARASVIGKIAIIRSSVERALYNGQIIVTERDPLRLRIDALALRAQTETSFAEIRSRLGEVERELDLYKAERLETFREELQDAAISDDDRRIIETELARGNSSFAYDSLIRARNGERLHESGERELPVFWRFFPRSAMAIWTALDEFQGNADRIVRHIASRRRIGPVSFIGLTEREARDSATVASHWLDAKRDRAIDPEKLSLILVALGFEDVVVEAVSRDAYAAVFKFTSKPIAKRSMIPVAWYGSRANGRYRVVCVWERGTKNVWRFIGDTNREDATLVFYFGRLNESMRREFAVESRGSRQRATFVVLDDVLLYWLLAEKAPRLHALFACSLPFTVLEPYTMTSGAVAPEMFYGRARDIESIVSQHGSGFIFGGRQIGKTALLRHVAELYNDVDGRGFFAYWLDLKQAGIGIAAPPDELGRVLVSALRKVGILGDRHVSLDERRTTPAIEEWLNADPNRRILFLLDEADAFLKQDEQLNYMMLEQLRRLMAHTQNRFKVVLAGLHNVQRSANSPNQSLVQLGEALNIGPLIENGEWRSALQLIEEPFQLLGFEFEEDVPFSLLAQANYYPSLLQIYGLFLMRHLSERATLDPSRTPPARITRAMVDRTAESGQLHDALQQRFRITLELDPRYEVIAYTLALELITRNATVEAGADVATLRSAALDYWRAGIVDLTLDSFQTLLNEMVGLGVLRRIGTSRYTLRSPMVLTLLGNEDKIIEELIKPREPLIQYEPAAFRESQDGRIGPLTTSQMLELTANSHHVSVIFGSEALGIEEVARYLKPRYEDDPRRIFTADINACMDLVTFEHDCSEFISRRSDLGSTLIIVPTLTPWSEGWIDAACARVRRLKSKQDTAQQRRFVHFVFLAEPSRTRAMIESGWFARTLEDVTIVELDRWHDNVVRFWLSESNIQGGSSSELRMELRGLTGYMPWLLERFRDCAHQRSFKEGLAELKRRFAQPDFRSAYRAAAGFADTAYAEIYRMMRDYDAFERPIPVEGDVKTYDVPVAELVELLDGTYTENTIQNALAWGERLRLVRRTSSEHWQLFSETGELFVE